MVTGEVYTRPQLNTDSEIVSLFERPTCPKPPDFPIRNVLAYYGVSIDGNPLLCSFSAHESGCFSYQLNKIAWKSESFDINEERSHAAGVSFGNDFWIITGGQTFLDDIPVLLNTSEILRRGEFGIGPELPKALSGHCAVNFFQEQIFFAGGYGEMGHLRDSFVLNINEEMAWKNVDLMEYGKFGHICGRVKTIF